MNNQRLLVTVLLSVLGFILGLWFWWVTGELLTQDRRMIDWSQWRGEVTARLKAIELELARHGWQPDKGGEANARPEARRQSSSVPPSVASSVNRD